MNSWSIVERSSQRIVTAEKLGKSYSPIANLLMFLLCCIPGFLALWFGIPSLPKTVSCKPNGNVSQCQETRKFLNVPIETHSFVRQKKISTPIVQDIGGNTMLAYGGLAYIGGIVGIILIYSSTVVTRRVWKFDRHRQVIVNEKYTALRRMERKYPQQDVFGIVLEITDIIVNATADLIFVRLNLQSGAQPLQFQPFNARQPVFYDSEYDRLKETIDRILIPTGELLQVPCQIKLISDRTCTVFDLERQCVDIFDCGNSFQIPFSDILDLGIEQSSDAQRVVSTSDDTSSDGDIYISHISQLLLVAKDGFCLPIHQVEYRESPGRWEQERERRSLRDDPSYRSIQVLQRNLERLLIAVPV